MQIPADVVIFETPEQLALAAAERFVEYAHARPEEHGRFSVALAGGRTPRRVYELLATEKVSNRIDWARVFLFFGDERCVASTHEDSNYAMVYESLISRVGIPAGNVYRIMGEADPEESARTYENQLRTFFVASDWPSFDLVFLGMGEDGHTASLFPSAESLSESSRWVVPTRNPDGQNRITLTLPALNQAAHLIFLVTGTEKAERLAEVGPGQSQHHTRLPAQLIQPVDKTGGTLEWFVDRAAAALL